MLKIKIKYYFEVRKILKQSKKILSKKLHFGFYIFDVNKKQIRIAKIRDILNFKLFLCYRLFSFNFGKLKKVDLLFGAGKYVLKLSGYCYCFYKTNDFFFLAYKNCKRFYSFFCYNKPNVYTFDLKQKISVISEIDGQECDDSFHKKLLFKYLFEQIEKEKKYKSDDFGIAFLQHGDVSPRNVLWKNNKPYFIDLDSIGPKPLLSDIIHYCISIKMSLNKISDLLIHNKKYYINLFRSFNSYNSDNDMLDVIYFNYLLYRIEIIFNEENINYYRLLFNNSLYKYKKTFHLIANNLKNVSFPINFTIPKIFYDAKH